MRILKNQGGFTLIEILATVALISIGFVAILEVFASSDNLSRQSRNLTAANNFAQSQLDSYRSRGYSALSNSVTDVTGSMPSLLGGTAGSCSSTTAKSACVYIAKLASTLIDGTGSSGSTSVATGADGNPIILQNNKRITKCGNPACTSGNVTNTVGITTSASSVAVTPDGVVFVAGFDTLFNSLQIYMCGDASCSTGTLTWDPQSEDGQGGSEAQMAVLDSGHPIVAHIGNSNLLVTRCLSITCSSTITTQIVTGASGPSIAIGSDGFPVISYLASGASHVQVLKCTSDNCSSYTINELAVTTASGTNADIAVGPDGLPVVTANGNGGNFYLSKCSDSACSNNTWVTLASGSPAGDPASVAISDGGTPVVTYRQSENTLVVIGCGNSNCSSGNTTTIPIQAGGSTKPDYMTVEMGADGLPIIAYIDTSQLDLYALKCTNLACTSDTNIARVTVVVKYLEGSLQKTLKLGTSVSENGLGT